MNSQFSLLRDRRFAPLFITQFLGAFNDNLMKSFFAVMVAYGLWDTAPFRPEMIVSIAAAVFILPFLLFCTLAGDITDRFDKAAVLRTIKTAEIFIVLAGIGAIYTQSTPLGLLVLFALGIHSAFFNPGKYAILPQQMQDGELMGANGLINTGTYLAILAGTITGTILAPVAYGKTAAAALLLICAAGGLLASLRIPPAPSSAPERQINWNIAATTWSIFRHAYTHPGGLFVIMLCGSWFYFFASTIHAQLPNFANSALGVDTGVLSLFLIVFSLGIAAGGLCNNRLLKGRISAQWVPWAALAMGAFLLDMYWTSLSFAGDTRQNGTLVGLSQFLTRPDGWRLLIDMLILAMAGGIYIVPLRALLQHRANKNNTARIVSGGATMDAFFILLSAILVTGLLAIGIDIREIFLFLSILTLAVCVILLKYRPFRNRKKREP